jgi:hypothetical protein
MQYGLYMNCFVCVLGGGFFLATAIFIKEDKEAASQAIKGTCFLHCSNRLSKFVCYIASELPCMRSRPMKTVLPPASLLLS